MIKLIDLTNSSIVKVNNNGFTSNFREYNGKIYYCRQSMTNYELIISRVAQFLEIECVNYEAAIINEQLYIVSESFISEKKSFKDGYDIISGYKKMHNINEIGSLSEERLNNLCCLSKILFEKYGADSYSMMEKLINIFSFDLIVGYNDRQSPNWGVIETPKNVVLAPMYDGKWSFNCDNPKLLVSAEDKNKSLDDIVCHFLNLASLESINNFENYYNNLDYNQLELIISKVSKTYNVNYDVNKILKNFMSRRESIAKVLKKKM